MESALAGWSDFNVAVAGAGAALAGLLIVAMSVNIVEILKTVTLPVRAGSSIGALVLGVAASCLALIPGQPVWLLGVEVLAGAAVVWLIEVFAARAILREAGQRPAFQAVKILAGSLPPAVFTVGAVLLVAGASDGYAWVAAGSVLSIISAVLFSWVALVEILR
ncbi:hypothetical protein ACFQ36_08570 [Arthrobacter sp. GCM10027362]|uniref:hypothetical protein n=1 Tax=Arthrobacter sp. GCM10027362 TaxID=3273379 RepID=UPI00363893C1